MKLWILGKKGLLGSTLERVCKKTNISFISTSKEEADISSKEHLKQFIEKNNCHDITHIVNCAAYTNVDKAEEERELAYQINALGPENVALIAQSIGAKVVHISTDYVFDGSQNTPYKEDSICSPINFYGQTKLEGEKNLLNILPFSCILRVSWLFGEGGKNFISSVFEKIQKEPFLKIVSDQKGRATFVSDVAEVILELLCHSGIYHFANKGELSRFEMANAILQKAKEMQIPLACSHIEPVSSSIFPTIAKRPSYSVLNTTKIEDLLGKSPRPWNQALNQYLSTFKYD